MRNFIDETGNKYGRLTVLYRDEGTKPIKWVCRCDCGKEVSVLGTSLRSGNTKSCGCLQRERARESNINRTCGDLTGKRFGRLVVQKQVEDRKTTNGKNQRMWLCKCDCGNTITTSTSVLTNGGTQSCGCLNKEIVSQRSVKREEGNVYGFLTVIEEAGRTKDGKVLWKCQCKCGNEKITTGKNLRLGLTKSCGCLHSKGEEKIALILQQNNIKIERQKNFDSLRNCNNYPVYFDFYLPDYNIIIEYQGELHYYSKDRGWHNQENFEKVQKSDDLKRHWCKENNIKMIEIPYTDYEKIDWNYLEEFIK